MIVEEVVYFLIDPLFILIILFALFKYLKSKRIFVIFFIFLFFINIFPTNNLINEYLIKFDEWNDNDIDGYIILGGSPDRILQGLKLADKNPNKKIIFTGGKSLYSDITQAEGAKKYLTLSKNENLFFEDKSSSTYENAKFSFDMFKPKKNEQFIIITSEYHSLRSYNIFKKTGWNVKSYYKKEENYNFFKSCCGSLKGQLKTTYKITDNLYKFKKLTNEVVALIYYNFKY
tara:strand:- start:2332 stop:3024 length:693 start_codon:yes stop_codon:yes gene_type:complete